VETSEPVALHHGREGGGAGHDEARPTASTACWAAPVGKRDTAVVNGYGAAGRIGAPVDEGGDIFGYNHVGSAKPRAFETPPRTGRIGQPLESWAKHNEVSSFVGLSESIPNQESLVRRTD
jgi:hypothetical protein